MNDVKFALRQLLKNPGFTSVAVLTLALGIGANTAIFSAIDGLLLKPLPYPEPQRIVTVWERNPQAGIDQEKVSGPNYLDWRAQNTVFTELAVTPGWGGIENFNLVLGDATVRIKASYTSSSLFTTLGTKPFLGRALLPEEDQTQGNRAAVLSYGLWRHYFGGSSNVIGQTLTVDTYGRRDYTIVGVMPPGFGAPGSCELWLPLGWMGVTLTERRSGHWHNVIARLKPGITLEHAREELSSIQARLKQAYPGETIGTEVAVVPLLHQAFGRNFRTALFILWGVVIGVLLIACANVTNLMLARAATRQKEIALRLALGAGSWRVVQQLLLESLLLASLGGATGVWLAWWGLHLFVATAPTDIPRLHELTIDMPVLTFTVGISLLAGLLGGLAPALQLSRPDLNEALKEATRGTSAGAPARRTRDALVVAEVAVSVLMLSGAGLMLQSFARMLQSERGFQPGHLLTAELDFSVSGFTTWVRPTSTRPQVPLKALLERLRAYPGLQAAGAGSRLLRQENVPPVAPFSIFGLSFVNVDEQPKAEFTGISPDWIRALGAHMVRGRDFTEADTLESAGVVIINETLARRFFPGRDPLSQRIRMGNNQPALNATNVWGLPEWSEIVGVVNDIKSLAPQPGAVPEVYVPYWQWPMQNPTLLLRTTGNPTALAEAVRHETKALIPNLPAPRTRTMDHVLSETIAQPRLQTGLLSLFAGLALALAAIGLYGVLAYTVTQRQHEIGIRMALGAQGRDVLALILSHGMKLALTGLALGLIAAFALTRVLRSLLYGITPTDPITFAAVSTLLAAVALLACWLPARRAAKLDPAEVLRDE